MGYRIQSESVSLCLLQEAQVKHLVESRLNTALNAGKPRKLLKPGEQCIYKTTWKMVVSRGPISNIEPENITTKLWLPKRAI